MIPVFSSRVLAWYEAHGRKYLPWQQSVTPYRVWVSEIMLQQTQVQTVIPYFQRFINRFPDILSVAKAPMDDVLQLWSGLGYYSRARNLHMAAKDIVRNHAGVFPESIEDAIKLPGIGPSTAGAILSLSLAQRHPILDGNVKRVLIRHAGIYGWPGETGITKQLWKLAEEYTPAEPRPAYTQAIMDLGALVCKRGKPACDVCPISEDCAARSTGQQKILPLAKPRKAIPVKHTVMLILQNPQGKLLFERRPPMGIWGGLLSFPEVESIANIQSWCRQTLNTCVQTFEELPLIEHKFSHFQLMINPILIHIHESAVSIRETDDYMWLPPESPGGGLPAPVNYLIKQFILKHIGVLKNGTHS